MDTPDVPDSPSALEAVASAGLSFATGVPAPVRRNAMKALSQLFTAAVDVPVAFLEGVAAETRALTDARVRLYQSVTDRVHDGLAISPKLIDAAARKFGEKIVREQTNLNEISHVAVEKLSVDAESKKSLPPPSEISEDWLNSFEREARDKSSKEMQQLFGRILAGEIQRPSSYSIRTIKIVSQLDLEAAEIFRKLCSLCVSTGPKSQLLDARVAVFKGTAGANSLASHGLSFSALLVLQECGLIISDLASYRDYYPSVIVDNNISFPMYYAGKKYALKPIGAVASEIRIAGVAFTKSGLELLSIVEIEESEEYTRELKVFLATKGVEMLEVPHL